MENKFTKIATLRNAMNYIAILTKLLKNHKNDSQSIDQLNQSDQSMDSLPDISFISSAELSSLSGLESDEESSKPAFNITNMINHHLNNNQINRTKIDCLGKSANQPSSKVFNIDASNLLEKKQIIACENSEVYSNSNDQSTRSMDKREDYSTENS